MAEEFDFNVPMPKRSPSGRSAKAHFMWRMPEGASKFVPETETKPATLVSYARVVAKRSAGERRFRVFRVEENGVAGVRVFRVAGEPPLRPVELLPTSAGL